MESANSYFVNALLSYLKRNKKGATKKRRRSYLGGGDKAFDALRADQERRAASELHQGRRSHAG